MSNEEMRRIYFFLLFFLLPLFELVEAQASVQLSKGCFSPGETLVVTFINENERADDWVGIFEEDEDLNNLNEYAAWTWACGDRGCEESASSGTLRIRQFVAPGRWKAILARNGGRPYLGYAVSETFEISGDCRNSENPGGNNMNTFLTILGDSFTSGEEIVAQFSSVNAKADDFIAIYPASASVNNLQDGLLWLWLCDRQGSSCSSGQEGGFVTFDESASWGTDDWPLPGGDYKAVLLEDTGPPYRAIAESSVFTIGARDSSGGNGSSGGGSGGGASSVSNAQAAGALQAARADIENLIRRDPDLPAKFLRMLFHDCIGGCDGCIDLDNPSHTGLAAPINILAPVVEEHSTPETGLSRSDIWALAAMVGSDMSQSQIPFDLEWWGRVDCENANEECRGPNGEVVSCSVTKGPHRPFPRVHMHTGDMFNFFRLEFGFDQRDTVAIMGAHTIGRMVQENSGIDGRNGWVLTSRTLDNEYYHELVGGSSPNDSVDILVNRAPEWDRAIERSGSRQTRVWVGLPNGIKIVMLNIDIAIVRDFNPDNFDAGIGRAMCAFEDSTSRENLPVCPHAEGAIQIAAEFKHDNEGWLIEFQDVLSRMISNGYRRPSCSDSVCKLELN